jgi:hypothetical protein
VRRSPLPALHRRANQLADGPDRRGHHQRGHHEQRNAPPRPQGPSLGARQAPATQRGRTSPTGWRSAASPTAGRATSTVSTACVSRTATMSDALVQKPKWAKRGPSPNPGGKRKLPPQATQAQGVQLENTGRKPDGTFAKGTRSTPRADPRVRSTSRPWPPSRSWRPTPRPFHARPWN